MTPAPVDTRWITMPSPTTPAAIGAKEQFQSTWRNEFLSFVQEQKKREEQRLKLRLQRRRDNEARVLATAYAEDEAKKILLTKRINGYRRQQLAYLEAVAQQSQFGTF